MEDSREEERSAIAAVAAAAPSAASPCSLSPAFTSRLWGQRWHWVHEGKGGYATLAARGGDDIGPAAVGSFLPGHDLVAGDDCHLELGVVGDVDLAAPEVPVRPRQGRGRGGVPVRVEAKDGQARTELDLFLDLDPNLGLSRNETSGRGGPNDARWAASPGSRCES